MGGILGGGSSINFMMYTRAQGIDFDSWETEGWAAKDMIPLCKKLETFHPSGEGFDKAVHGYDGNSYSHFTVVNFANEKKRTNPYLRWWI